MKNQLLGEVRILGGRWKRTKLPVPSMPGLRPTPSRVRETLFNWLGHDLTGRRVLDVFAGSGALGLESASRGATHVTLLEQHPALCAALTRLCERLPAPEVEVIRSEALFWMQRCTQHFDLIFLDPPFTADLQQPSLHAAAQLASPHGLIYLESDHPLSDQDLPAPWAIHRQSRAGVVHFHLLMRRA
jgi:16S rRNA (guanine(966)-N(2))-methyltransferase RsmD